MKLSLDELTVIHSDLVGALSEMTAQLTAWEVKTKKKNEEQRVRLDAIGRAAETYESMLGALVVYWRKNTHLSQGLLDVSAKLKQAQDEIDILKQTLNNEQI